MTDLPVDELLTRLRAALGREFGEIRFWGFAVVRPSDRRWRLESVEREGSTLLLGLRDMAGPPLPALLSTHPATAERIAWLREAVTNRKAGPVEPIAIDWRSIGRASR